MKRPFAALLLAPLGLALIAGLRLAVPHMFDGASGNEAEQASHVTVSRAAHAPSTIEASEPALSEAVDPLLYAGAGQDSSGASENAGWIDSAIERGALLGGFGNRPDGSSASRQKTQALRVTAAQAAQHHSAASTFRAPRVE